MPAAIFDAYDPDTLDRRDATFIASILPFFDLFNRAYVRLKVTGETNIPRTPAIFVSNHNGGISGPDLSCTLATLWNALGPETPLHCLAHDFAMRRLTPLGRVLQKFGAVSASQSNARRAIAQGSSILVYPGGDLDAFRHTRRRDEVVLGERTGFVRLAQFSGVPIVPIVVHGAHRSAFIFREGRRVRGHALGRFLRLERFPLALALPWGVALGPLPYLPLPFAVRLTVLAPIDVPLEADPAIVREDIRAAMQAQLTTMAEASR